MRKNINTFISGIMAGIAIALGGTVFLSVDNKIIGAVAFTVGLFCVCTMGFSLFTGKVCYALDNDKAYAANLIIIWLGNLAGTFLTAWVLRLTRIAPTISEKATALAETKLSDGLLSIFILAIFCNIMIYIAVDGFNNNPHEIGKYLALFFGVVVFILCGFEHCIANMFYFSVAGAWSARTLLYVLVMTAGNAVGGLILPTLRKIVLAN